METETAKTPEMILMGHLSTANVEFNLDAMMEVLKEDSEEGFIMRACLSAMKEYASEQKQELKAEIIQKIEDHQKLPDTDTSAFWALERLKEGIA